MSAAPKSTPQAAWLFLSPSHLSWEGMVQAGKPSKGEPGKGMQAQTKLFPQVLPGFWVILVMVRNNSELSAVEAIAKGRM